MNLMRQKGYERFRDNKAEGKIPQKLIQGSSWDTASEENMNLKRGYVKTNLKEKLKKSYLVKLDDNEPVENKKSGSVTRFFGIFFLFH